MDLLREAVYAKYRQERIWHAETGQIEIAIAENERELQRALPSAGCATHLANGFAHSEVMVKLYLRYDAQLHRHFKSCIQQIYDLQDRRRSEPLSPMEPNHPTNPDPLAHSDSCGVPSDPTANSEADGHSPDSPKEPNEPPAPEPLSAVPEPEAPITPVAASPIAAPAPPATQPPVVAVISEPPIEAKPPKTEAQLFEEHRERLLARFYPAPHQPGN